MQRLLNINFVPPTSMATLQSPVPMNMYKASSSCHDDNGNGNDDDGGEKENSIFGIYFHQANMIRRPIISVAILET